jgi:hypothetical protein
MNQSNFLLQVKSNYIGITIKDLFEIEFICHVLLSFVCEAMQKRDICFEIPLKCFGNGIPVSTCHQVIHDYNGVRQSSVYSED